MNFVGFIQNFALRPDGGTIIVFEMCVNSGTGPDLLDCQQNQFSPGKKTMLYEVNTASAVVTPIGSIITNSSYGNKPYLAFDFIENPYPTLPGFVVAPDGQSVYISQNSQSASASELINKIWHVDISVYREGTRAPFPGSPPNPCVYEYSGPDAVEATKGNCDITTTHSHRITNS